MKNKFLIIISIISLITLQACNKQNTEKDNFSNNNDNSINELLFKCLENELGAYIIGETGDLIDIPLNEITNVHKEKITYYKGVYSSSNKENMYVIYFPKNGTYEYEVMKDFDNYFKNKNNIYQRSEIQSVSIYINNKNNDVDFNAIKNKCKTITNNKNVTKINDNIINKLNKTTKIIIKSGKSELGTITNLQQIEKFKSAISESKRYGNTCLSDGYGFNFEIYNNNSLLDTIHVWSDGKRILPESIDNECYYSISNNIDLRKIIEEETDYIFYSILDLRDEYKENKQLIYSDNNYKYYLKSQNTDDILIKFMINNQVMTLKQALENKYIKAETISNDYPDILIKK